MQIFDELSRLSTQLYNGQQISEQPVKKLGFI